MTPFIMLQLHAVVALVTGILIAGYNRGQSRHKWYYSTLAYLLALAFLSIPIRIWVGSYPVIDPSELVVNIGFMVVMIISRGNITGKRSQA
ncbi:phage holin family protein [Leclercia adecarboxylata]|uniref:phage holin family protein n=1 Tax=Leclercia adecarboxylata TaxID=83655 RepID=UPI003018B035